jgi:hypothetical protein
MENGFQKTTTSSATIQLFTMGMVCLRTVACGDRKDFFAVHAHVAFPSEMQHARELQRVGLS